MKLGITVSFQGHSIFANVYKFIRLNFNEAYLCRSDMTNLIQKTLALFYLFEEIMTLYLKPSLIGQLETA